MTLSQDSSEEHRDQICSNGAGWQLDAMVNHKGLDAWGLVCAAFSPASLPIGKGCLQVALDIGRRRAGAGLL